MLGISLGRDSKTIMLSCCRELFLEFRKGFFPLQVCRKKIDFQEGVGYLLKVIIRCTGGLWVKGLLSSRIRKGRKMVDFFCKR